MANTTLNQEDLIEIQRLSDVKTLKVLHIKNSKFGNIVFPNSISNARQKYQKHKIKDILPIFDEALTEWENMKNNGYDRFWDCGNLVFTFELKCAKIEKKD